MKIIEKIEIKNFRSFLWTPKEFSLEVADILDLSIFSWWNDSWKSNLLRALNLFFNSNTSFWEIFDFSRDLSFWKKDSWSRVIEISLSFNLNDEQSPNNFLPRKFKITKYYNKDWYRNSIYSFNLIKTKDYLVKIDSRWESYNDKVEEYLTRELWVSKTPREVTYRRQFAWFIDSVHFEYVPAIREQYFYSNLFWRCILALGLDNDSWKKITNSIKSLENSINSNLKKLIGAIDFLPSSFKVWENLRDFFESFDIWTWNSKSISIKSRWDWIQAKYIPKMLDFISLKSNKKFFIWWFEEPENSAEYKNQNLLAKDLKDIYIKSKQIFLTTHSEEFLQMYDAANIDKDKRVANLYHVKIFEDKKLWNFSKISLFNVDSNQFEFLNQKTQIEDDLGHSILRAKYSKELKELSDKFLEEKSANISLNSEIQLLRKPILFVEDEYEQIYKLAWLKLNGKYTDINNIDNDFELHSSFLIVSKNWHTNVKGILNTTTLIEFIWKKIIGLFDFDEAFESFSALKSSNGWSLIQWDETVGFFKKRQWHNCFYAMLLPVPKFRNSIASFLYASKSSLEVEYLFEDSILNRVLPTWATKILPWKIEIKVVSNKSDFYKKVKDEPIDSFVNFRPLFKRVNEFFEIDI